MSRTLLVLRPEPGACATLRAARAMGLAAVATPLFSVRPVPWELPPAHPDAVLMTSANAARHGGAPLAALANLPLYAVGAATATAAREAGFATIVTGDRDAAAIVERAGGDGIVRLLHLAGRDRREPPRDGLTIDVRTVYRSDAVDAFADGAFPEDAVALLHSPRAAALFARLAPHRSTIALAAISEATRAAAGDGWRETIVAESPNDPALLAAAAKLCDH